MSTPSTVSGPSPGYAEIAANDALALVTVACFLLDRQLAAQGAAFKEESGFSEQMYRERTRTRRPDRT